MTMVSMQTAVDNMLVLLNNANQKVTADIWDGGVDFKFPDGKVYTLIFSLDGSMPDEIEDDHMPSVILDIQTNYPFLT